MTNRSILTQIKHAASVKEIERLLSEGEKFEEASDRTRARWQRKAAKRREELEEPL
jgi:DNA-binding transcriptional MerR regulator